MSPRAPGFAAVDQKPTPRSAEALYLAAAFADAEASLRELLPLCAARGPADGSTLAVADRAYLAVGMLMAGIRRSQR